MTQAEALEAQTGYPTFDEARAYHHGFMNAIKDIRMELNRSGKSTPWFDAMLDQVEENECEFFATQVVGG
jgi:hypothetical protein